MQLSSLSLALTAIYGSGFAWRNLFAGGTPGFRINIEEALRINAAAGGDLSKCVAFQDSAGTLPVTAMEQPLGLILDTKLGVPVLGPELVTNGGFDTSAGWAVDAGWTIAGGKAVFTQTGSGNRNVYRTGHVVAAGKWYVVEFDVLSGTGFRPYLGGFIAGPASTAVGRYRSIALATANGNVLVNGSAATNGEIDNISVREVPGNHFAQPSNTPSRPIVSRRVNLLTATEDFDDAYWRKQGVTVSSNAAAAPEVTQMADKLTESTANEYHRIYNNAIVAATIAGAVYEVSVYVKAVGRSTVSIQFVGVGAPPSNNGCSYNLDALTTSAQTNVTGSIEDVGNGWRRLVCSCVGSGSGALGLRIGVGGINSVYTGDGTSGIYIWGADLRLSIDANLPPYQRVTSSTDYDESGFPAYAKFDGVDDWLESGVVDMSSTDEVTVIAGVTKLSDAGTGTLVELGIGAQNGSFFVGAPTETSPSYLSFIRGTVNSFAATYSFAAPAKTLIAVIGDISADRNTLRANGAQVAQSTTDQGTGNFGNYKAYIGRRSGVSAPFNGRIYGVTVIGKLLTDSQLAAAERAERNLGRLY